MTQALIAVLERELAKRRTETAQTRAVVSALVKRDPGAEVFMTDLRHAVRFATGRNVGDAELVEAVACAVATAFAERPKRDRGPRPRVIVGCRWKGQPKAILRAMSRHARPSHYARACRYFRHVDWSQYPKQHRSIFEAWAVFGQSAPRIAHAFGLAELDVQAVLTLHRARAGITRSNHK